MSAGYNMFQDERIDLMLLKLCLIILLERTKVISAITCINISGSGSSLFQIKTNVTGPGYSIFY